MLPYALKIVWFSLSLSGLLSCWAVLSAFAVAVRSHWLALLYCIGCTILQGIFCLGLIWRMDPSLMPRSFCIAQTLLSGLASFMLTGVSATFSMITSLAVLRPGVCSLASSKPFIWHPIYTLTLIVFPLLASVAQITAVLKLDAVQPGDDFACDATDPEWVRFLSYAGVPLVFSIPFSCLGLMALLRMSRIQQRTVGHYCDSPDHGVNSLNLTSLPRKRTRRKDMRQFLGPSKSPTPIPTPRAISSPSPSDAYAASPGRAPINPGLSSPVLSARQFHLPFSPSPVNDDHDPLGSCHSSTLENQDDTGSSVSSAFPTFAPPSNSGTPNPRESPGHDFVGYLAGFNPEYHFQSSHPAQAQARYSPTTGWNWNDHDDDVSSIDWTQCDTRNETNLNYVDAELDYVRSHGKNQYEFRKEAGDLEVADESRTGAKNSPSIYTPQHLQEDPSTMFSGRRPIFTISPLARNSALEDASKIRPALWRIVIFQLSFTLTLVLACISTLVDVTSRRTRPTPFGTQHVALLLAAWGPVVIFGFIPSTRRNLFWKRPVWNL
ncbi:hypothetical protein F5879DRAFT_57794 [Lentinula edodes]|nr:hypothetical protein F5879DRAFT_57794 [Lentinula edodes]